MISAVVISAVVSGGPPGAGLAAAAVAVTVKRTGPDTGPAGKVHLPVDY